jgi:hypothetical protein
LISPQPEQLSQFVATPGHGTYQAAVIKTNAQRNAHMLRNAKVRSISEFIRPVGVDPFGQERGEAIFD